MVGRRLHVGEARERRSESPSNHCKSRYALRVSTPSDPRSKVCPECRSEYFATTSQCVDCGIALVHPEEIVDEIPEELPPTTDLVPIRIASVSWMRGFSDVLSEAGLAHRVDLPPTADNEVERVKRRSHDDGVAVYVRPEDQERALALDSAYLRDQIPDAPEDAPAQPSVLEEDSCPACGDPLAPHEPECPGCGLFVGTGE